MHPLKLFVGSKNFSSWSMRPWLALVHAGIAFDEVVIPFHMVEGSRTYTPEVYRRLREVSPSGKVPVLHVGGWVIHESLAICEYVAELAPEAGLWPDPQEARAVARAISAEMHAGFIALRTFLPMSCRDERKGPITPPREVMADVVRIQKIWLECRERYGAGGPFLFGRFTLADAMYAPVVTRFTTYAVPGDREIARYMDAVLSHPALQRWYAAAVGEMISIPQISEIIAQYPSIVPGTAKI